MDRIITEIMNALQTQYEENSTGKTMEYTYGYMDALAVIREAAEKHKCRR